MEIIVRDSEVVINKLEASKITPVITADTRITKLVIEDAAISISILDDSKVGVI